jgi:hypothetical protein
MSQFFSRKLKKKAPGPKMSKLKGNGHMIADSSKRMNGKWCLFRMPNQQTVKPAMIVFRTKKVNKSEILEENVKFFWVKELLNQYFFVGLFLGS